MCAYVKVVVDCGGVAVGCVEQHAYGSHWNVVRFEVVAASLSWWRCWFEVAEVGGVVVGAYVVLVGIGVDYCLGDLFEMWSFLYCSS